MEIAILNCDHYSSLADSSRVELEAPSESAGQRLDQTLATLFPEFSRSRWQSWIRDGHVLVDGRSLSPSSRLWGGERLCLTPQPSGEDPGEVAPQPVPFDILYEDQSVLVINKSPGLIVHPGNGHRDGTLQNGLLHHDPGLAGVPRAGIVHRLDKDTSGLMVVARTLAAQTHLVRQLQARTVKRHYWALVEGAVLADGVIDVPVGRHSIHRTRMAVTNAGRPAVTHFHVVRRLPRHTLLECRLETGRTHQIRVHLQHAGHPLAADPVYGGRKLDRDAGQRAALEAFGRQALHAFRLGLIHPLTDQQREWEIPMAPDMARLINALEGGEHD